MKPQATKLNWQPRRTPRRTMATKYQPMKKRDWFGLACLVILLVGLSLAATEAVGSEVEIGYVSYKEQIRDGESRIGMSMLGGIWDYCIATDDQFKAFDYTDKIAIRRGSRECLTVHEIGE